MAGDAELVERDDAVVTVVLPAGWTTPACVWPPLLRMGWSSALRSAQRRA